MSYKEKIKTMWGNIRNVVISGDFIFSLFASTIALCILPEKIPNDFSRDIYNVGITSLSIIFSVYFAALAIIISSGDNDFIDFFEQEGDYTRLIKNFRYALWILLIALLSSIFLYTITSFLISQKEVNQIKYLIVGFSFFSLYGLLATFMAANDAIRYALYRVKFLRLKKIGKAKKDSSNS
jgi:hypothetical protein